MKKSSVLWAVDVGSHAIEAAMQRAHLLELPLKLRKLVMLKPNLLEIFVRL